MGGICPCIIKAGPKKGSRCTSKITNVKTGTCGRHKNECIREIHEEKEVPLIEEKTIQIVDVEIPKAVFEEEGEIKEVEIYAEKSLEDDWETVQVTEEELFSILENKVDIRNIDVEQMNFVLNEVNRCIMNFNQ